MNISIKTIKKTSELLGAMLQTYQPKIDQAYLKADDSLTVNLGVKFKPNNGQLEIETSIKFVTDQVKDNAKILYDEKQAELFPRKEEKKEEPANGREKWFSLPKGWPVGATLLEGLKPVYPRRVAGPDGMVTAYFPAN